ncbi:MAG: ABC transporter ATP-binding protein [Anaerolineales bacterium]
MALNPTQNKKQPILEIKALTKDFRGLRALSNVDLFVQENEILGVIGPNGAGKTTLFNLITGLIHPTHGKIVFIDKDITNLEPDTITKLGIGRTFQNIRLFNAMTVLDNVRVALQLHTSVNPVGVFVSSPNFLNKEKDLENRAMNLLTSFGLENFRNYEAGSLPYAHQRRLEIARALALQPKLLLLDEPTAGMNPSESQDLLQLILRLHEQYHLTIILIAHDMRFVMNLCQRVQVLNQGETIAVGLPDEVRGMPQVIEAYLGRSVHA